METVEAGELLPSSEEITDGEGERKPGFKDRSLHPFQHPAKRRRGVPLALKQPLVVLNEMFGKVEYEIVPTGDGVSSGFQASFSHEGERYEGFGLSKSKAKCEAAKNLLRALDIAFSDQPDQAVLNPEQNLSLPARSMGLVRSPDSQVISDFSEDITNPLGGDFENTAASYINPLQLQHPLEMNLRRLQQMRIPFNVQRASEFPAMVLNELFPNIQGQLTWLDTDSAQRFCCTVEIAGQTFHGIGVGKRAARVELARSVLSTFFGVKPLKSLTSTLSSTTSSTLGKMHPYAKVKWLDPDSKYVFEKVEGEGEDEKAMWKAKLIMKGKEYESLHSDKDKAKFQVAKMGFQDNCSAGDTDLSMPITKEIDTKKHPLQMFFEYYKNPEFMEEEVRNQNLTYFLVAIKVDGQIYSASSLSKKKAKVKLALKIFDKVHGINIESWPSLKDDVKSEYIEDQNFSETEIKMEVFPSQNENIPVSKVPKSSTEVAKKVPAESNGKNSVSILYELHQDVSFIFGEENSNSSEERFTCFITVSGKSFDGSGPNKKSAKQAAASRALEILYGIKDSLVENDSKPQNQNHTDMSSDFADKVVAAVQSKLSYVFQRDVSYKVVASILMAKEQNGVMLDRIEVLCIGTGTKCVGGESLSTSGKSLNDCHAEIIACRGFRQFLYDQLELAMKGKESCLERAPKSRLFQIKTGLRLYLYINTAPCGDGRVYNLTSASSNNKTIGMLRTKIENGQGECIIFTDFLVEI